jgi:hypothetical protein
MKMTAAASALVVLCALVAVGCGGGSASPGVASVAATAPATTSSTSGASKGSAKGTFSACMRSHGVPKFPDPSSDGSMTFDASTGINPDSPRFQAAQRACQKLAPNGGKPPSPAEQAKAQAQMLKFSACMRAHGLAKFPDPQFNGNGGRLTLDRNSGLDPNSPIFQAAQKACQKDLPKLKGGTTRQVGGPGSGPAGGSTQGAGK